MYESIILGDPQCLANDAERLMWQHCFQQFFDPISRNATRLKAEQLRKAMELLHIASNYYFCLIRKVAKVGSASAEEIVLSVPTSLRWNNTEYESQDAFVVEMIYRMYIHMGDIVRYRSAIFPTVVYRAYPTAEKLYQYALSLKPNESIPFSRLGMLCSSVGRPIEAACYHLRGSRTKERPEVSSQYFSLLLTENERHYYLSAEERKGTDKRKTGEHVSEAFIYSTLRVARYLYSNTAESQDCQLPSMVEENIQLLNLCFQLLLKRRFNGFVYCDISSSTIISLITMQMELIELLEEKGSKKRLVAERWLLSVFHCVVDLTVRIVARMYSSIPSVTGSRKVKESQLLTASGNITAKMANGNDNDLAKVACVTVLRKLRALHQIPWLKVLKVICNWLQLHPEELRSMDAGSWARFVSLVNLLPTEFELSDVYARYKKIAKELSGLFYLPLSEWEQEVSLPEDACVFEVLKLNLHQGIVTRRMSDTTACFLRVCCLRKYAHEFMRHTFTGLQMDNWTLKFVPPDSINGGATKVPSLPTMKSPENLPQDNIAYDGAIRSRQSHYDRSAVYSRPTTFLIVDVLSLCSKLSFMKELVQSNEFTVVICISVTDQLHEWKAGMLSARQAIAWIEYEWVHSNRALMVRTSDSCSEKWEGELADVTLELVRMYDLLIKKPPYPMHRVLLITDYSSNSEEFKRIYAQAKEYSVQDIDVRNVCDFYAEWIKKEY
ncbi:hypothetical protein D918_04826 [Trichuris suis]|nr:hypothetical protein D918_04826 [Trichuris suis]